MLIKTKGIIIKTTRYGETSLIAKIFTSEKGMLSFMIPGVYSKSGSVKPAYFLPLQILEMEIYFHEGKNLNKIKETRPACVLNSLHSDMNKMAVASIITELLAKCIKEEESNEVLFSFLQETILKLEAQAGPDSMFFIVFMLNLTKILGFYPSGKYTENERYFHLKEGCFFNIPDDPHYTIDPPLSHVFSELLSDNTTFISADQRHILLEKLIYYYRCHIPEFYSLKSLQVLGAVFTS